MRDTFDVEFEPGTEVALSVEFTEFHGVVDEPIEVAQFGGIGGCAIASAATGVSTRAEVQAMNSKAELSSRSILLKQKIYEEEEKIQMQQYKSCSRDLIQVCRVRAVAYAHSTSMIIGLERGRDSRVKGLVTS